MSLLFPQLYVSSPSRCSGARYAPARCGSSRYRSGAPLWNFLEEALNEVQRVSQSVERPFNPRFDVQESKDHFTLTGEVPGVNQEDISVEFTDEKTIQIKGHTQTHTETGKQSEAENTTTTTEGVDTSASDTASTTKTLQATVEDEDLIAAGENEWIDVTANEKQKQKQVEQPQSENEKQDTAEPEQQQQEEPKQPAAPETQSWLSERRYGEFSRSFRFTTRVNRDAVTASLKNGVLQIVVPKAAPLESRRINVD